jgi:hypothetical protein
MKTTVFFRSDDVGALSPALRAVVELLLAERVPCNYQVVPMYLSKEAAEYIREKRRAHPELFVLNQHGYKHEDHRNGQQTYEEFGGHRSFDDQLAALATGRRMLVEMLGAEFSGDVFTPPCHKYDENTLAALHTLGFRVLSAGVKPGIPSRAYYELGRALGKISLFGKRVSYHGQKTPASIKELSASVDVDPEVANGPVKSYDELVADFQTARAEQEIVGIMLHHEAYTNPLKVDTLRRFSRFIQQQPNIELKTIETIAERLS